MKSEMKVRTVILMITIGIYGSLLFLTVLIALFGEARQNALNDMIRRQQTENIELQNEVIRLKAASDVVHVMELFLPQECLREASKIKFEVDKIMKDMENARINKEKNRQADRQSDKPVKTNDGATAEYDSLCLPELPFCIK